jgi:hypothetical protein
MKLIENISSSAAERCRAAAVEGAPDELADQRHAAQRRRAQAQRSGRNNAAAPTLNSNISAMPDADRRQRMDRERRRHDVDQHADERLTCARRRAGRCPAAPPRRPGSVAAARLWVVKAQIHAGGRGKAGGVKLAKSSTSEKTSARACSA